MTQNLPPTVDKAVESILKIMSQEEIQIVKSCNSVYELHFSLGAYIRSNFQPYIGFNESLIKDCIRCKGVNPNGDSDTLRFIMIKLQGDECTTIILKALKKKVLLEDDLL